MGRRRRGILIDEVDARIIECLQHDSRTPNTAIARKVKLTEAAVRKRIQRLVEEDVVTFRAYADPLKIGFQVWAAYQIQAQLDMLADVAEAVAKLPWVCHVFLGTGEFDVYAVAVFRSTEEFTAFTNERLPRIPGVIRTRTSFITKIVKRDFAFGVPLMDDRNDQPAPRQRRPGPKSEQDSVRVRH